MELGQKLKKIREFKNITQEYIAFQIGMSQQAYCKIEQDSTKMTVQHLLKIANVLNVKASILLEQDIKNIIFNID